MRVRVPLLLARGLGKPPSIFSPVHHTVRHHSWNLILKNSPRLPLTNVPPTLDPPHPRAAERTLFTSPVLDGVKKGEKKKPQKAAKIDLREVSDVVDVDKFIGQMDHHIEELKNNFIKHLTLRSSIGSIEQITVTFDGADFLLQELVQVVRKPKMVVLNVTTFPQAIPQVLEAINKSGLNLNPQQDGTTLFIPLPKVTKEHREGLAKNAKALFIKCRDSLKDVRNKELKNLKRQESISEDQVRRVQSQLEAICDKYVKEAEGIFDTKQKELLKSNE